MRHTHPVDLVRNRDGDPPDLTTSPTSTPSTPLAALTRALSVTGMRVDDLHAHVSVEGSLDLATIHLLTGVLEAQLGLGRRHVRLDLSRVTVSDCGCLRQLRSVHEQFLAAHGMLILDPVTSELLSLLKITGLDRALFATAPVSPAEPTTLRVRADPAPPSPVWPAGAALSRPAL